MRTAHLSIVDVEDARHTLALTGELDITSAPALEEAVSRSWEAGTEHVILDLAGLRFIDSTGLQAILKLRRADMPLSIMNENDTVRRVFELTGVPLHAA